MILNILNSSVLGVRNVLHSPYSQFSTVERIHKNPLCYHKDTLLFRKGCMRSYSMYIYLEFLILFMEIFQIVHFMLIMSYNTTIQVVKFSDSLFTT